MERFCVAAKELCAAAAAAGRPLTGTCKYYDSIDFAVADSLGGDI
jgi:hypothetical protein